MVLKLLFVLIISRFEGLRLQKSYKFALRTFVNPHTGAVKVVYFLSSIKARRNSDLFSVSWDKRVRRRNDIMIDKVETLFRLVCRVSSNRRRDRIREFFRNKA